ncbi:MAG: class I SAM-dependent methyltransferase [Thermofilaceae archaeon]
MASQAPVDGASNSFVEKYLSHHFIYCNLAGFTPLSLLEHYREMARCYKRWYGPFLPEDRDAWILDIGCGMGHFLYFLKKEGYRNFLGVDISREQVNFVRKYITDKVVEADAFTFLEGAPFQFDVIVMNDFLEHIPKVRVLSFLSLVYRSLKENGKVFVKTINAANPFNLRARYMDFTHETAYTEHSLAQVLRASGFKIIALFGDYCPGSSVRGYLNNIIRKVFLLMIRKMFILQGIPPPNILDKNIIAIASK